MKRKRKIVFFIFSLFIMWPGHKKGSVWSLLVRGLDQVSRLGVRVRDLGLDMADHSH